MILNTTHIGKSVRYKNEIHGILTDVYGGGRDRDKYVIIDNKVLNPQHNDGNWELSDTPVKLSLLEAMETGLPFRHSDWNFEDDCGWMEPNEDGELQDCFTKDKITVTTDLLKATYVLKPEPKAVNITAYQLYKAIDDYYVKICGFAMPNWAAPMKVFLAKELGL